MATGARRRPRGAATEIPIASQSALLEDEEEDLHVFLRDLGEQRLKDLDRPVRLYQAAADGLPDDVPARSGADAALAEAAGGGRTPLLEATAGCRR